jgi:hypothetical protein
MTTPQRNYSDQLRKGNELVHRNVTVTHFTVTNVAVSNFRDTPKIYVFQTDKLHRTFYSGF